MEGVVLADVHSGALVFTRSFTDAFDLRHPRTERMNLSALLFALLSFADSSLCVGSDESSVPSISAFTTPIERIVFAQTPSRKLFVALFTVPTLDVDVAKSLARRLAYNYEHGTSLESRIAVVLNQGPRQFRDALSRSIEEQVDELLEDFVAQICSGANGGSSDPKPPFIIFYFSDHMLYKKLRELAENQSDDGSSSAFASPAPTTSTAATSPLGALGFRSPLALGLPSATVSPRHATTTNADSGANTAPARSGLTRSQSGMSFRSVYASTRSLFLDPASRASAGDSSQQQLQHRGGRKKPKKKNAVMNHAEPQVLQRLVQFSQQSTPGSESGYVVGEGSADAIACVVVPFVKEVVPLFFTKSKRVPSQQKASRVELKQIRWENFPLEASASTTSSAVVDLTAWKQGNCLLIYPERTASSSTASSSDTTAIESERAAVVSVSSESARLRRLREKKLAVVALFDALEPLAQARMIGRT